MRRVPGVTLIELVIVIIIVGVLASLALPRFFLMIERSRAAEAITNIGVIRQAMERCYVMAGEGIIEDAGIKKAPCLMRPRQRPTAILLMI